MFDAGTFIHLAIGRPGLLGETSAILGTVAHPDARERDPRDGRERFYRRHADGRRWLRVVVDFGETPAWIVTAIVQEQPSETLAPMTLTIAGIPFDRHVYDARGDVLYVNVGDPQEASAGWETPEGHALHYDADGRIIGMTLLNVRWTLERDGELLVTLPEAHVAAEALGPVLAA